MNLFMRLVGLLLCGLLCESVKTLGKKLRALKSIREWHINVKIREIRIIKFCYSIISLTTLCTNLLEATLCLFASFFYFSHNLSIKKQRTNDFTHITECQTIEISFRNMLQHQIKREMTFFIIFLFGFGFLGEIKNWKTLKFSILRMRKKNLFNVCCVENLQSAMSTKLFFYSSNKLGNERNFDEIKEKWNQTRKYTNLAPLIKGDGLWKSKILFFEFFFQREMKKKKF